MMDVGNQKLRIDLVAPIPEIFSSFLNSGIIKIAINKGLVEIITHNLHEYSNDKFKHIDDTPYGGGAGMIIGCEPVFKCIRGLLSQRNYDDVIYMTADGAPLKQSIANELSMTKSLIILAGRYKGIDQRIRDNLITREISIGDYVLSGGELPAMVLTDTIIRLIPGAIGDAESSLSDSFQEGLLEPPQYTKPADFEGLKVPDVLLSGNHTQIAKWRDEQAMNKTMRLRPDLLK